MIEWGAACQREAVNVVRINDAVDQTVEVKVELFGRARIATGHREITVVVPNRAGARDVAAALLESCPELEGLAVLEDGSGLLESYTLNLNGTTFIGESPVSLEPGDVLLLFSSQAGG